MNYKDISFRLRVYENAGALNDADRALLNSAKSAIPDSYSPYSNFKVAASVLLDNNETVTGTNQEVAAYPVCICAEGTALSAASSLYPNVAVKKIAITVKSANQVLSRPVAPCGVCRQRLVEYENRYKRPIEIIMCGEEGEVYVASSAKDLLPLGFSGSDL